MDKIGLIQLGKSGDLLQTARLIKNLKEEFKDSVVYLIHNELFIETAKLTPADRLVPLDLTEITSVSEKNNLVSYSLDYNKTGSPELMKLKNYSFDFLINPNSSSLASDLVKILNCPRNAGYGSSDIESLNRIYYPLSFIRSRRLNTFNLVDIYANMFYIAPDKATIPQKKLPSLHSLKSVVLQLSSRNTKRQWPLHFFSVLAHKLIKLGCHIVLTGNSDEIRQGEVFRQELLNTGFSRTDLNSKVIDLTGKTDIPGLVKTLGESDLLVTTDTGTMHFAAYAGCPSVVIFTGPAYPFETLGYTSKACAIIPDPEKFRCYPCSDDSVCPFEFECQKSILPEAVIKLILEEENNLTVFYPDFDELGLILRPKNYDIVRDELIMAYLYRDFAFSYVFGLVKNRQDWQYLQSPVYPEFYKKLQRETAIVRTLSDSERTAPFYNNLELLRPFFFLEKFYGKRILSAFNNFIQTRINS